MPGRAFSTKRGAEVWAFYAQFGRPIYLLGVFHVYNGHLTPPRGQKENFKFKFFFPFYQSYLLLYYFYSSMCSSCPSRFQSSLLEDKQTFKFGVAKRALGLYYHQWHQRKVNHLHGRTQPEEGVVATITE